MTLEVARGNMRLKTSGYMGKEVLWNNSTSTWAGLSPSIHEFADELMASGLRPQDSVPSEQCAMFAACGHVTVLANRGTKPFPAASRLLPQLQSLSLAMVSGGTLGKLGRS
jgi:hypothetical protein